MQGLKELILLLHQHNVHPLKHLVGSLESKLLALYEGISRSKYHTDEEAATSLYKGKKNTLSASNPPWSSITPISCTCTAT